MKHIVFSSRPASMFWDLAGILRKDKSNLYKSILMGLCQWIEDKVYDCKECGYILKLHMFDHLFFYPISMIYIVSHVFQYFRQAHM